MKSANITHMDKDEIFFVSEHAVETVTNTIKNFKEANKNYIRVSQGLKYNSYNGRKFIAKISR
jgi:uroporphyrinogen-III synthase